jgi:hypothetical protein
VSEGIFATGQALVEAKPSSRASRRDDRTRPALRAWNSALRVPDEAEATSVPSPPTWRSSSSPDGPPSPRPAASGEIWVGARRSRRRLSRRPPDSRLLASFRSLGYARMDRGERLAPVVLVRFVRGRSSVPSATKHHSICSVRRAGLLGDAAGSRLFPARPVGLESAY